MPGLVTKSGLVTKIDCELQNSEFFWLQYGEFDHVDSIVLAESCQPEDWQALEAIWRLRPVAWQRCFATVLASVCPPSAVTWLFEMIECGEDELALHAIDELREMQRERALHTPWPKSAVDRVRTLWRQHRGFTAGQLEQFLYDMGHGR